MKTATLAERVQTLHAPPRLALVPAEPLWNQELPASTTPTTDQMRACSRPPQVLPAEIESAIVATLVRRVEHDHRVGNDLRERELIELFVQLTPVQNLDLRRRIASQRADDDLAQAFKRLVVERRQRLVSFLEDPRRRLRRKT